MVAGRRCGAAGVAFLPVTAAAGTAAVLVPLATDTAGGAIGQVIGQTIGEVSGQSVGEHKGKVEDVIDDERERIFRGGESMTAAPFEEFLSSNRITSDRVAIENLWSFMSQGYMEGIARENQFGNRPMS